MRIKYIWDFASNNMKDKQIKGHSGFNTKIGVVLAAAGSAISGNNHWQWLSWWCTISTIHPVKRVRTAGWAVQLKHKKT